MTETLEAPIHSAVEECAGDESTNKSSAAKASRSKATVKAKSTTKGSKSSRAASVAKASRSRATESGTARGKGKGNDREDEFGFAAQAVVELPANGAEKLSANGAAPTEESPAVEPPVIRSADDEELQPSPPAAGSEQERTRRRAPSWAAVRSWVGSNLLLSGLAVALVVALVFLTLTQLSLNSTNSLNGARTSALVAAKSYAVDLASYNYQHLGQDFGKVLAESDPTFKQDFTQSSEALKTALVRYDASASASVVAAGLVSATNSRAVVLVFLNQTVKNTLQRTNPTTESRVEITLLRSGGRWLIDEVTLL